MPIRSCSRWATCRRRRRLEVIGERALESSAATFFCGKVWLLEHAAQTMSMTPLALMALETSRRMSMLAARAQCSLARIHAHAYQASWNTCSRAPNPCSTRSLRPTMSRVPAPGARARCAARALEFRIGVLGSARRPARRRRPMSGGRRRGLICSTRSTSSPSCSGESPKLSGSSAFVVGSADLLVAGRLLRVVDGVADHQTKVGPNG
jgi:hypothetical protein